ncbi:hypothetical protein LY76DRAFT_307389 [Colletotrichum caudatum]|nr:hypothetical protein LY76DRAFT_307389 [Colletotrichum caudatum]
MRLGVLTLLPKIRRYGTKPVLVFSGTPSFPSSRLFVPSWHLCLVVLWVIPSSAIYTSCIPKSSSALDHDNLPRLIVEAFALAAEIVRFPLSSCIIFICHCPFVPYNHSIQFRKPPLLPVFPPPPTTRSYSPV